MKAHLLQMALAIAVVSAGVAEASSAAASDSACAAATQPAALKPPPPMVEAAMEGDVQKIRSLAAGGTSANGAAGDFMTPLMWASARGHEDAVQVLLELGADPNARDQVGVTALWQAARTGRLAIVKTLVARHVDLDVRVLRRLGGNTPLMVAADNGHADVAKFLVLHGADARARDAKGHTAAQLAASSGHTELAKWLRSHSGA